VEVDLAEEIGVNSGEEIVVEERGLLRMEERDWIVDEESLEKEGEEVEEDVEVVRLRLVVEKVGDLPHDGCWEGGESIWIMEGELVRGHWFYSERSLVSVRGVERAM